jgi:hypothetical protein
MPAVNDIQFPDSALRAPRPHLHDLLDRPLLVLSLYPKPPRRLGDMCDLAIPLRHNLGHRICLIKRLSNLRIRLELQALQ